MEQKIKPVHSYWHNWPAVENPILEYCLLYLLNWERIHFWALKQSTVPPGVFHHICNTHVRICIRSSAYQLGRPSRSLLEKVGNKNVVCWWAVAVCKKYLMPTTTTPNVSDPMDTALVPIVLTKLFTIPVPITPLWSQIPDHLIVFAEAFFRKYTNETGKSRQDWDRRWTALQGTRIYLASHCCLDYYLVQWER